MIRAALLLCLSLGLAAPAMATTDAWPALYDVAGVAFDDVLNVRAGPDASTEIVGHLAHDAEGVELIRPSDDHEWARVNVDGRAGWVSLNFVARQPGQWYGQIPEVRRCLGNEPFWGLAFSGDGTARFSTPEGDAPGSVSQRWASENRRDRYAITGRLDSGIDGQEFLGVLQLAQCSDFMSDREYGIGIDLLIGGMAGARMLSGCCSLAGD